MSHYVPIETGIKSYHVGADREYRSFTQLVWDLKGDESEKIIFVHGGTYDIFREYRESNIPRPPHEMETVHCYRPYNAIIPKNTHVIGIGRVIFTYGPSAEQTYLTESKVISLLNLADSATIENIELTGYNCRYLIHDETLGLPEFDGAQKRYYQVRCVRRRANDGELGNHACIGFGFDNNMQIEFDDCELINTMGGRAFYVHNRGKSGDSFHNHPEREPYDRRIYTEEESSRITVNNCIIEADSEDGISAKLGNCSKKPQNIITEFNDCRFKGSIGAIDEDNSSRGACMNAYNIRVKGCGDVKVIVHDPGNRFEPRIYK